MILRKPYAFLIKHFRIIHLLLTILLSFIAYNTNRLYVFFRDYIKASNHLRIFVEPKITSVPWYIYILIILSVVIISSIFILMNRKKKPTKYYLISIVFYLLLIIVLIFSDSQIFSLIQDRADIKIINIAKDILRIFTYAEFIFVFIALFRTLGFNIKKFDFKNDLKEMDILEEDREEFEFSINLDSNDINTKFRRAFRILKYVINENKILVLVLTIGLVSYIIIKLFLSIFVYNRLYRQNEKYTVGDFQMKVTNSYKTTKSYDLKDITSNKYIFFIVSTEVKNVSNQTKTLKIENIRLKVDDYQSYETNKKYYSNFLDIGEGYYKQEIKPNEVKNYIFVFAVDKQYSDTSKTFEVLKNLTMEDGEIKYNYVKVKIKPKNYDKIEENGNYSLKDKMVIQNNFIGKISMTVESIDFVDNYDYSYKEMVNEKEYTFTNSIQQSYDDYYGKKLLKLKMNLEFENIINESMLNDFISNFAHIRYLKNGKEYDNPFKIKQKQTTSDDEYKYIEVYEGMVDAENIWLDIIIRNEKYTYKIK